MRENAFIAGAVVGVLLTALVATLGDGGEEDFAAVARLQCEQALAATRVAEHPESPLGPEEWAEWCRDDPVPAAQAIGMVSQWPANGRETGRGLK